jgi:CRP-like cAMP-binding protein
MPLSDKELAILAALPVELFAGLEEVAGVVARRRFAAGQVLFAAGQPASTMGVLLEGAARAGDHRLGPGQVVAEQDVARDLIWYSTDIVAETDGLLVEVDAGRFRQWFRTCVWRER